MPPSRSLCAKSPAATVASDLLAYYDTILLRIRRSAGRLEGNLGALIDCTSLLCDPFDAAASWGAQDPTRGDAIMGSWRREVGAAERLATGGAYQWQEVY